MTVIALNVGSSTLKWSVFESTGTLRGSDSLSWKTDDLATRDAQIDQALRALPDCSAVGHRIVHGGEVFAHSVAVDASVREQLEALSVLDELHMRPALLVLDAAMSAFPRAKHVAVFDTAFHRTMSAAASGYALPKEWTKKWGIRRFGFHGLSVAWSVETAHRILGRELPRILVAHLGSGCSVTAVRDGSSCDTTMGFTPLEGLMMATRAGSVDAGVLFDLNLRHDISVEELQQTLTEKSGLLGVSGLSSDIRVIIEAADRGNADAKLAYERFILYARRAVGAMSGVLGGVDALVFTGGIAEHQAVVRRDVAAAFGSDLSPRPSAGSLPPCQSFRIDSDR